MLRHQHKSGNLCRWYVRLAGGLVLAFMFPTSSPKRARQLAEQMHGDVELILPAPSPWVEELPLDKHLYENSLKAQTQ